MKGKNHSIETKSKISKAFNKKIICLDTMEVFESIKEAAYYFNGFSSNLSAHLNGERKFFKRKIFKYFNEVNL